jgi:hypothetical protein
LNWHSTFTWGYEVLAGKWQANALHCSCSPRDGTWRRIESAVAEIDQQTGFYSGGAQVVAGLRLVVGGYGFYCFQLRDHLACNYDIRVRVTGAFTSDDRLGRMLGQCGRAFFAEGQEALPAYASIPEIPRPDSW